MLLDCSNSKTKTEIVEVEYEDSTSRQEPQPQKHFLLEISGYNKDMWKKRESTAFNTNEDTIFKHMREI